MENVCLAADVYFYLRESNVDYFIDLLKKYNVGCKNSRIPCVGMYVFKQNYYTILKGDAILCFTMDLDLYIEKKYSIGQKLFEFPRVESEFMARNIMNGDDEIIRRLFSACAGENDREYKDYKYFLYKLYEELPFTNDEYNFISSLEEYNIDQLEDDLELEGIVTLDDLADYEEVSFEAALPEKEYVERINSLFAIIDNEIEAYAPFPEDESIKVIQLDLGLIKKEIKEIASDNGLTVKVNSKGLELEIFREYKIIKPLYMQELTDFYNFYYTDSDELKLELARELRKKETNTYY